MQIKNDTKAFTLLELLVLVVIIGILAAIALPQYQMAVGKSRFSTLKNLTRSIAESSARYYMISNDYPKSITDLDISLNVNRAYFGLFFEIELKSGEICDIWTKKQQPKVACDKKIFGKSVRYYINRDNFQPDMCLVYSTDKTDKANRLCQKETNRKPNDPFPYVSCNNEDGYCTYKY